MAQIRSFAIPKETKQGEGRVALLPMHVEALVANKCNVIMETGAADLAGFSDDDYAKVGCIISSDTEEVWANESNSLKIIVKVKEPSKKELKLLTLETAVFGFMHYAANEYLLEVSRLQSSWRTQGDNCLIAYEDIILNGEAPILKPMSDIAGRMAMINGFKLLAEKAGILVTGTPVSPPAKVVILGAGVVGQSAARVAAGVGASVLISDIDYRKLEGVLRLPFNVSPIHADSPALSKCIADCDILVGATYTRGKTPHIVTEKMLKSMKTDSIFIDVSIDQGGCSPTSKPTSHKKPTYIEHGVHHYCVPNIPGSVPKTSSLALSHAVFPFVKELWQNGGINMAR